MHLLLQVQGPEHRQLCHILAACVHARPLLQADEAHSLVAHLPPRWQVWTRQEPGDRDPHGRPAALQEPESPGEGAACESAAVVVIGPWNSHPASKAKPFPGT